MLTFTVYILREHLHLMQWAVSKFSENILCLWVGKDLCYYPVGNINKIIYPTGFVLQWALSACVFSVLTLYLLCTYILGYSLRVNV